MILLRPYCWLVVLFTLLLSLPTGAQNYQVRQHFNSNNGLPQNSVVRMELDTAGYLWIATESGLVRYDGGALVTVELKGTGSPPPKRIRQLVPTYLGEMIVEDAKGNIYDIHGHVSPILRAPYRQRTFFRGAMPSVKLHVALSKPRQPYTPDISGQIVHHATGPHDWLVIRSDSVRHWHDSTVTHLVPIARPMQQVFFLDNEAIGFGLDGNAYHIEVGTGAVTSLIVQGAPLYRLNESSHVHWHYRMTQAFMVSGEELYRIELDRNARRLDFTAIDTWIPPASTITDILGIPHAGVIIIGTATTGMYVLQEELLGTVACAGRTVGRVAVFAQASLDDGGLLFATGYQAYRADQGECVMIPDLDGMDPFTMAKDTDGWIWVWVGADLIRFDPVTRTKQVIMQDVSHYTVLKAQGDSVLIGTGTAIFNWWNGHITRSVPVQAQDYSEWPKALIVDHDGRLMYGAERGLFIQDGNGFTKVPELENTDVRAISLVEDLLLVGTYGNGWYVVREGRAERMPEDPLGCLQYAHSFTLRNGILWISTNRGLIRTTLRDIRTYLADPDQRPYLARYGSASGMGNLEFNGGCEPPMVELANGVLSYPAIEGLVQFTPGAIPDPFPKGELIHGRIRVNGANWPIDKPLDLPYNVGDIQFDLSLPYWGEAENAQLEYRIPGVVDRWRRLNTGQRTIEIVRPPSGRYQLYVRKVGAASRDLVIRPFHGFIVKRPIWATWQAYGIYLGVSILLFLVGAKWNTARLRRSNRWLEENVAVQTEALLRVNNELRIAVSHQEKLISVISHDVVPPLRFVARVAHSAERLLKEGGSGNDLAETLADLSASTDKLYSNAESLLTWIRTRSQRSEPEFRTIRVREFISTALERVHEMFDQAGIDTSNTVGISDVLRTDMDLFGIVVHNLLMNVRAHAQAHYLTVSGRSDEREYVLSLTDDGVGIPEGIRTRLMAELNGDAPVNDPDRAGPATGLGFVIVAECMRQLHGSIALHSDESGTRVDIHLPHRVGAEDS